jgi:hypothetical protein
MRFTVLALTLVVTATSALDAQGQFLGRRRRERDCCVPPPQTCCQPAPVQTACCAPGLPYGRPAFQSYPQTLPGYGAAAMAMPMSQTSPNPITQTGGVQATDGGQSATTTAQGQPIQPTPPGQAPMPMGYGGAPMYGPYASAVAGGDCCCEVAGTTRRRGLFRRY